MRIVTTGQPSEAGILGEDAVSLDASGLLRKAGDAVIRNGDEVYAGLPVPVQIRNQAGAATHPTACPARSV